MENLFGGSLHSVPKELLQALFNALDIESFNSVPIICIRVILSSYIDSAHINFALNPIQILKFSVAHYRLSSISLVGSALSDRLLTVLSQSSTAPSLRELNSLGFASAASDSSASVWSNFPSLEKLSLSGPLLTLKTYDQLFSALPSLTILNSGPATTGDLLPLLCCALSLLTNLRHLRFEHYCREGGASGREGEDPVEILRQNAPLRASLRSLKWESMDLEILKPIAALCPNLSALHVPLKTNADLTWASEHFSTLQVLSLEPNEELSQSYVDRIAVFFPNLQTLILADSGRHISINLEPLSSVTFFHFSGSCQAIRLPTSLTNLTVRATTPFHASAYSKFLAEIPRLPKLKVLDLQDEGHLQMTRDQFESILASCPKLSKARFGSVNIGLAGSLDISHPKLSRVGLDEGVCVIPRFLPKLAHLGAAPFEQIAAVLKQPFPYVKRIQIDCVAHEDISGASRLPALRVLSLTHPNHLQLNSLRAISRLESLSLFHCSIAYDVIHSILPHLRNLRDFKLVSDLTPPPRTLNWLQSSTLMHFAFSNRRPPPNNHVPVDVVFELSAARLPRLLSASIEIVRAKNATFSLSHLPSLETFGLELPNDSGGTVSVDCVDCPELSVLSISCASIGALKLTALPSLSSVCLFPSHFVHAPELFLPDSFEALAELKFEFHFTCRPTDSDEQHAKTLKDEFMLRAPNARLL